VVINPNDTQTITVYNDPIGGVEIIKVNADDTRERIPNTTFEIRRMGGILPLHLGGFPRLHIDGLFLCVGNIALVL